MQGTLTTIKTNGTVDTVRVDSPNNLDKLQAAVGGYIETIPYFDRYEGKLCVAFCNEEGKTDGLPVNEKATDLWYAQGKWHGGDQLVGDIVIVQGDEAFMSAL